MSNDSEDILIKLERALSGANNTKVLRFLLNCLSGTPYVGGGFSASAGIWSEREQDKKNNMFVEFAKITDERINRLEKSLVGSHDSSHLVAGFITFNPNKAKFIDSSEISSLSDNGVLDFTINFTKGFNNYVFNYYGSGNVILKKVEEDIHGMRVVFDTPCPDKVTFVFFEAQPNKALQPTPKSGKAELYS